MHRLLVALVVIAVIIGAFLVGNTVISGSNRPRSLPVGESAQVRLRGSLLLNQEGAITKYRLVGNGWTVYLDLSGVGLEGLAKAEQSVGKTLTIAGTQRHEIFLGPADSEGTQRQQEDDVLFASSISD